MIKSNRPFFKNDPKIQVTMISWFFILLIRLYQMTISPLLGICCRFHPTCSIYMIEALKIHGPLKGFWLGIKRLCKCHPWHPGGHDPHP